MLAIFNVAWSLADRAVVWDSPASVTSTQVAFSPGLLAAQVRVQITNGGFVRIHMQVDVLMADSHLACNLLGAPLNAQIEIHIGPYLGIYTAGITAAFGSFKHLGAGLLGKVPTQATPAKKFAADGAEVSAQQSGDLADRLFGFQETVNLVSFFSAEELVHLAT